MKAMLNSPMYTPSYELSKYLFENGPKRDEYINSKIEHLSLSNSVAINLTGRHTCLLYTSPSPRDKRQSRMPSSA